MARLVEFDLEDGGHVIVESNAPEQTTGSQPVSRNGVIVEKAKATFEKSLGAIKPIAAGVMKTLHELNNPDELTLEFGITMTAEAGAILAAASGSANLKISLKWKNANPNEP